METETNNTEMAAGNPTDKVPKETFWANVKCFGDNVITLVFLIFASTIKKQSIEITLESMVATAAPATCIPNTKIKIGSRIMFITPPMVRPIPASFVLPTERTKWPNTKPATVGIPPTTKTQNK